MSDQFLIHFSALPDDVKELFDSLCDDEQSNVKMIFSKNSNLPLIDIIYDIYDGNYSEFHCPLIDAIKQSFVDNVCDFGDFNELLPFIDFEKIAPLLENKYFFVDGPMVIHLFAER